MQYPLNPTPMQDRTEAINALIKRWIEKKASLEEKPLLKILEDDKTKAIKNNDGKVKHD